MKKAEKQFNFVFFLENISNYFRNEWKHLKNIHREILGACRWQGTN